QPQTNLWARRPAQRRKAFAADPRSGGTPRESPSEASENPSAREACAGRAPNEMLSENRTPGARESAPSKGFWRLGMVLTTAGQFGKPPSNLNEPSRRIPLHPAEPRLQPSSRICGAADPSRADSASGSGQGSRGRRRASPRGPGAGAPQPPRERNPPIRADLRATRAEHAAH